MPENEAASPSPKTKYGDRKEGGLDHPFYHFDTEREYERHINVDGYARFFYYETFTIYRQRMAVAKGLRDDTPISPELMEVYEERGKFSPKEVIDLFKEARQKEMLNLAEKLAKAHNEEQQDKVSFYTQILADVQTFNLHDVWLLGTWDTDWEIRGDRPPETYFQRGEYQFHQDQFLGFIEQAMDLASHRPENGKTS